MDYAHDLVDIRIKKLSKQLEKEYSQALIDLEIKAREYFDHFQKQDAINRDKVKAGTMSSAEYKKWRKNKMLYNKRYEEMIDGLANDLSHVDELAANLIYESIPYSYADAANVTAYEIEKATLQENFSIYNYDAAYETLRANNLLPPPADPKAIPKSLMWNKRAINSAIMQGILQGESIPKVAKRLQNVTNMDKNTAIRNARTIHTAAENKGRQDCYKRAQKMGIETAQQWIATHDERTREAHRELDGVIQELDKPFENSIGKIRYPSDPQAHPANVYNCRCALIAVLKDYPYTITRADDYESIAEYEEWKKAKPVYKTKKKGKK